MAWSYRTPRCSFCNYPSVHHIGAEHYCARHAAENDGPRWKREAEEAWGELRRMTSPVYANRWHEDVWPTGNYGGDSWMDIARKIQGKIKRLQEQVVCHTPVRGLQ